MENFCLVGFTRNYYVRYLIGTLIKWKFTSKLFPLSTKVRRWRFSLLDFLFMAFRCFLPCVKKENSGKHFFVSAFFDCYGDIVSFVTNVFYYFFDIISRSHSLPMCKHSQTNKFLYLFYSLEVERRRNENEIIHRQTVRWNKIYVDR